MVDEWNRAFKECAWTAKGPDSGYKHQMKPDQNAGMIE